MKPDYTPLDGGGEATPPPYPFRLRMFIYGCAIFAQEHEAKLAGAKVQRARFGG